MSTPHCTSDQAVAAVAQNLMCLAMDVFSAWLASNRLLLNASKTQFIWLGGSRRLAGIDRSPLPSQTLAFRIRFGTWGSFLTKSSASPCISTNSLLLLSAPPPVVGYFLLFVLQLDPGGLASGSNWLSWSGSSLCCPSHWMHTKICFCFSMDAWHPALLAQHISYKIAVLVWQCLLGSAPAYLCELCRPVSGLPERRALRSSASYWCLVLKLKLDRVVHSPSLDHPPGMDSLWKSASCLKIVKVRSAGCSRRLICIVVAGLGLLWVDFLKGRLIDSWINEWMNNCRCERMLVCIICLNIAVYTILACDQDIAKRSQNLEY